LLLFHDLAFLDDQGRVVELGHILSKKNVQSEEDHSIKALVYLWIV